MIRKPYFAALVRPDMIRKPYFAALVRLAIRREALLRCASFVLT
jgi:hypothetical protein